MNFFYVWPRRLNVEGRDHVRFNNVCTFALKKQACCYVVLYLIIMDEIAIKHMVSNGFILCVLAFIYFLQ